MSLVDELGSALTLDMQSAGVPAVLPSTPLTSDLTLKQVRIVQLYRSFLKKFRQNGDQSDARALAKFREINARLPDPRLPFVYPVENEMDQRIWDGLRANLCALLTSTADFSLSAMAAGLKPGPGATVGTENSTQLSKLFESRISVTSEHLLARYRAAISDTSFFARAERLRFERYGVEIVQGNRLFFVPKNIEISRTCCTEPTVNALFQQAIGGQLERCLEAIGFDIRSQEERNKRLAQRGSIDGSFGTIDSTSASDSYGLALTRALLCTQPQLLGWIEMCRSPTTRLPDGSEEMLRMVSTMGNGFTFPLMTLTFAMLVKTVYQYTLPGVDFRREAGVYGDDIVVRREAYPQVVRALKKLGFLVNDDKSFNDGFFRESCGGDYWMGHPVRGIYIQKLNTQADVYSAINRLTRFGAAVGLNFSNTIVKLRSLLWKELRTPPSSGFDSGLHVPSSLTSQGTWVSPTGWYRYRQLRARTTHRACDIVHDEVADDLAISDDESADGWAVCALAGWARTPERSLTEDWIDDWVLDRLDRRLHLTERALQGAETVYKEVWNEVPWWDFAPLDAGFRAATAIPLRDSSSRGPNEGLDLNVDYGAWKAYVERALNGVSPV